MLRPSIAPLLAAICLALTPAAAAGLEFGPYGRGGFAQLRKAHAGRPLVVHFWSVTCPPCLAELPDWGKFVREKKDIDIVFVNTDPDGDRARAVARLEKAGLAEAAHFGFSDSFAERLYFEADKGWRGELPFTALIGADGAVETVTGAIDDPAIAEWLAKAGKAQK